MTKNYQQSSSLLTKCFRFHKTIPTPIVRSPAKPYPLSSVIEAIQTIDRLVQTTKNNYHKQQGDFSCLPKSMNTEQIEEMLVKWTHIAHFLVDAYQQAMTEKNSSL